MGMFADKSKRAVPSLAVLSPGRRLELPPRFEAVAEALISGSDTVAACSVLGREFGAEGVPLEDALSALAETSRIVCGTAPRHEATAALAIAWSESTLGYLHQVSCVDPVTGLASQIHLRTTISDIYATGADASAWALVLAELRPRSPGVSMAGLDSAMALAEAGRAAKTVFVNGETVGRLGKHCLAVLARRDDRLGARAGLLRRLLDNSKDTSRDTRVWIEGLPENDTVAALLLDDLSR